MIQVKIEIKSGKEWVHRAALATKGKKPKKDSFLKDELWFNLLRAKHSPIEEYEIWVDAIVPENVHIHIVRHKEIGKYVATSRIDFGGSKLIFDGVQHRSLALRINAKRLIEICEQRLCRDAMIETRQFIEAIVETLPDETLKNLCVEPCVKYAWCIGQKKCGYIRTLEYEKKREYFTKI